MNDLSHLGLDEHGEPEKKGRGCLFWGCLTIVLILFLMGLAIGGLGYVMYGQVDQALQKLEPLVVAERPDIAGDARVDPEQIKVIEEKMESFYDACTAGEDKTVVLTEDMVSSALLELSNRMQTIWKQNGIQEKEVAIDIDLNKPYIHAELLLGLSIFSDIDFLGMLAKHNLLDKYMHVSMKLKPDVVDGHAGFYLMDMTIHGKEDVSAAEKMTNGEYLFLDMTRIKEAELEENDNVRQFVNCVSSMKVTDEGLELIHTE